MALIAIQFECDFGVYLCCICNAKVTNSLRSNVTHVAKQANEWLKNNGK